MSTIKGLCMSTQRGLHSSTLKGIYISSLPIEGALFVEYGAEGALNVDSQAVYIVAEGALDVFAAAAPLRVAVKGRAWWLVSSLFLVL